MDSNVVYGIFREDCFQKLINSEISEFIEENCHMFTITKGLGLAIVLGSLTLKVPQILKVIANQSGEGLSLFGLFAECLGWSNFIAYNHLQGNPFSTWGEALFIFIQNLILAVFIGKYTAGISLTLLMIVLACPAFLAVSLTEFIPKEITVLIFSLQFVNTIIGRAPQIYANFQAKSTGQLSFITTFLQAAGGLARLFTILQEVPDDLVILTATVPCVLSWIIIFQFFLYWTDSKKKKE